MTNREFNEKRTGLANAFATAGAELLEYMGSSSALAAIPDTDPPKYVAAGPLKEIAKLLPAFGDAAEQPTGDLTDEQWIFDLAADHEARGNGLFGPVTFNATGLVEFTRAAIAAYLAGQSQVTKVQAVPEGWKLVPFKYTPEMRAAWDRAPQSEDDDIEFGSAWTAMLYAAPTAQEVTQKASADLHNAIMNLPCKPGRAIAMHGASKQAYQEGHRDARHAAAELVNEAEAAQEVTQQAAPEEVRQCVRDAIADALAGLYYYGRVWSAWSYGTMSQDDFSPADEDDNIIENVTEAAMNAMVLANVTQQAAKAETAEQANVLVAQPKLYARLMEMSDIIRADGHWTGNEFAFAEKSESDVSMLDDILGDALRLAAEPPVAQSSIAGAAKGGEDKPESSDLAPTTSTARAPKGDAA